jgi:hypothetical protein
MTIDRRRSNPLVLTLFGTILVAALCGGAVVGIRAHQNRAVVQSLLKPESSVVALYGDYTYTARPTPNFAGFSFVNGRGQRVHGFTVGDEPSRVIRPLVSLFGEHTFTGVSAVHWDGVTDADLLLLANVPELRELYLERSNVTDVGIQQITRLRQLTVLDISSALVTESGLRQLRACPNLRELDLAGTVAGDSVVAELKQALPNCQIVR